MRSVFDPIEDFLSRDTKQKKIKRKAAKAANRCNICKLKKRGKDHEQGTHHKRASSKSN